MNDLIAPFNVEWNRLQNESHHNKGSCLQAINCFVIVS